MFREHGDANVYPSKARHGETFIWGENDHLFERLTSIRRFVERTLPQIAASTTTWLIPPDATGLRGTAVWTQTPIGDATFVFAVNYDLDHPSGYFGVPMLDPAVQLVEVFSTVRGDVDDATAITSNGFFHRIDDLGPGEGIAYRIVR